VVDRNNLRLFCEHILERYPSLDDVTSEILADEFRDMFLSDLPVSPKTLEAVAESLGIKVSAGPTPKGVRGYNDMFEGKMNIYYKNDDCRSGKENTILHEIRELMEHVFNEMCPDYQPLRTLAVHNAANRFAAAVLLPREEFQNKVYETGFDIVALGEFYWKSCAQIIIRIAEVLQGGMFYYGALYEPFRIVRPEYRVTYWSASSNEDELSISSQLFPRKGRSVVSGSLVDEAIQRRVPCLVERIVTSETENVGHLTAIAQPIIYGDTIYRVTLVAVLRQDRDAIQPQVERVNPVIVPNFYQHL
jgi:hypothetical protein